MVTEILEQLASDANNILSTNTANRSALANQNAILPPSLVPFAVGALGNFPYYWQNPANLKFNHLTYNWISSNLKANAKPVQLDQIFTNYYIEALGSISYQLSTADENSLTTARQNAVNEQFALLSAWQSAYGSIPPATATQQPIDIIINTIATTWASPPASWTALQTTSNLSALLNNMPASGKTILPVLAQYLNALGSSISLQNEVSMNTGFVQQALAAVQNPSSMNGAISTDNNLMNPAYEIATPLADILSGLNTTSNTITLTMIVSSASSNGYSVSVSSDTSINVNPSEFFLLYIENNIDYFKALVAKSENPIQLEMTFTGVTMVEYAPVSYDSSTGQDWYWIEPITEAIKNGTSDVSGFKFSPNPNIDFSVNGPFGYLSSVAISNYPTVKITVTGANYRDAAKTFQQSSSFNPAFLGVSLNEGNNSVYAGSSQIDDANSRAILNLEPPASSVAPQSLTSTGWVLGVQVEYPATS